MKKLFFYKLSLTKNRLKLKPKWIGCSSKRWRWGNLETGMEMFFLLLLSRWTLSRKKERRRIRSKRKREKKWKWNEELNKKPGTFKKFAWRRKRSFVFWFVDSNEVMRTQMTWWAEWLSGFLLDVGVAEKSRGFSSHANIQGRLSKIRGKLGSLT